MYYFCHMFKLSIIFLLIALIRFSAAGQEICNNNIDDDGDRLVDLFDVEDCVCSRDTSSISMIPNPSFEQLDCMPTSYSQLHCARSWNQATLATSDLFVGGSYVPSWKDISASDGISFVGTIVDMGYIEYLGTCLTGSMLAGQPYTLRFDVAYDNYNLTDPNAFVHGPIDFALYGRSECGQFPIETMHCLSADYGWSTLGDVTYVPSGNWVTMEISFTPTQDISSIILGASCSPSPDYNIPSYFFWDNLRLKRDVPELIYYVPNAFTPNGDEHNQQFKPVMVCDYDPLDYQFEVYNRWGEIVFQSFDPNAGWDGLYNGRPAEEGVYLWRLAFKSMDKNDKKQLTGHFSMLK
jgi:gliding motility-associated-like protein